MSAASPRLVRPCQFADFLLNRLLRSAAIIGSPPKFRGGTRQPQDLELQLLKNFPDIAMFVEKPVATGQPFQESIDDALKIAKILTDRGNIVSVGYMLRYLACVQYVSRIILHVVGASRTNLFSFAGK